MVSNFGVQNDHCDKSLMVMAARKQLGFGYLAKSASLSSLSLGKFAMVS